METKKCNTCGVEKDKTQDFALNGKFHRGICKECQSAKEKGRYTEINRLYRKGNEKEKYQLNRDKILESTKTKDYKDKRNKNLRHRRQTDFAFCVIAAYRARLNEVLQKQKRNTYIQYVHCTRDGLLDWLEFQFGNNYEWKTYGKEWVIDHVIPIDFFDLTNAEHLYRCFGWFNLRPCKRTENQQKSNKIELGTIEEHQKTLDIFTTMKKPSANKTDGRYQARIEMYEWLRKELRYGKNPSVLGDPQPSS